MVSQGESSPRDAELAAAEGTKRGTLGKVVTVLAVIIGLYHLFYLLGAFGYLKIFWLAPQHKAISFFCLMMVTFLIYPGRKAPRQGVRWYDFVLIIASSVPMLYMAFFYETVLEHFTFGTSEPYERVLGIIFLIVVLEAIRRTVGWGMVVIVVFFIIHPLISEYLPGVFHGRGFSIARLVNMLYLGEDGVLGMPASIAATMVFAFILFGQVINTTGGATYFIDVAQSLLGHMRGGPAKGAIVASGLFGMISGSTIANIATTGTFTIPLMKRIGYPADFAGGVESVASNGGQIMPPIMGIVAFVMASFLEMSYIKICFYALLPAVLYYIAVFVMVDLQAVKLGLRGLPRSELPSFKKIFWRGWFLPIPIFVLIYLLAVLRYSPEKAALYSVAALVLCTLFSRRTRLTPAKGVAILEGTARGMTTIVAATAGAGIIIGSTVLTGLGVNLSAAVISLSGGNVLALLGLTAMASFILGIGSTGLVCYIMLAILVAPALVQMGILPVAAHLFVFYWGIVAYITPPVCLGVYMASAISGAPVWQTGWWAVRLGIATFILPFMFALNPALLMVGSIGEVSLAALTAVIGITALSCGIQGHMFFYRVNWVQRVIVLIGALTLIYPGLVTDAIGGSLVALVVLWNLGLWRHARSSLAT